MEPYEFEALEWLQRNTAKNALGHNQFRGTQEAIEAVKRLYAAGAIEVRVGPVLDDPESLAKFGGPYSSVLKIVFRPNKRKEILAIARSMHPDDADNLRHEVWYDHDKGTASVMLSWD